MIVLQPGLSLSVNYGGTAVQVATPDMGGTGGLIVNPLTAKDQGIPTAESIYVSMIGLPGTDEGSPTGTTEIVPGRAFLVPPNVNVWLNAVSSGHKFTAFFASPYTVPPAQPVPGVPSPGQPTGRQKFNVPGYLAGSPTGLLEGIPSYLYQEYSDDDNLQGFVEAQNSLQQDYVDTFNALNLPIYPGQLVEGALLDWVGKGLYGMPRPALSSGIKNLIGPLNTWGPNGTTPYGYFWPLPLNGYKEATTEDIVTTDDDTYRRVLTWHFYKGDGNYFSVRWLKRRVWRFLYGENGTAPNTVGDGVGDESIADTEQISVSMGVNGAVSIRFVLGNRTVTGGAMPNAWGPNGFGLPVPSPELSTVPITLNDIESTYQALPALPFMSIFKEALEAGVLEMPYQFNFSVAIG
jgi:hypothetical protein